jgi:Domain of unknown function (DUF5658)
MERLSCVLALALVVVSAVPAGAQQEQAAAAEPQGPGMSAARPDPGQSLPSSAPAGSIAAATAKRPSVLLPMYTSFAALQGLDYASTGRALKSGAGREGNPVMAPIVMNRPAFMAVKVATAVGTIWAAEKLRKHNRRAAVALMAVMNGAVAVVVAHNMSMR